MVGGKKVTLREIAKKADVSTALVSNILNGKGRASEKVRNKVLGLLEDSGYRPRYARKSFVYVMDLDRVIHGKSIPFLRMFKGVEQTLEQEGIQLRVEFLTAPRGEKARSNKEQFEQVAEHKPGAVFISTDEDWLDRGCAFFEKHDIPVMQLGYDTENPRYSAVVVDSFSGAYNAVRHLIDSGHTRIATIRWTFGLSGVNSNKKLAGFRTALLDAGLELPDSYVREVQSGQGQSGWQPTRKYVEELLQLPEPPTAIFVDNSALSPSLIYPLSGDTNGIPEHIRALDVVHSEDFPLDPVEDIVSGKLFHPPRRLKVLAFDWEGIGRYAARLLVDRVQGNAAATGAQTMRVAPILQLVEGTSRTPIERTPSDSGESE